MHDFFIIRLLPRVAPMLLVLVTLPCVLASLFWQATHTQRSAWIVVMPPPLCLIPSHPIVCGGWIMQRLQQGFFFKSICTTPWLHQFHLRFAVNFRVVADSAPKFSPKELFVIFRFYRGFFYFGTIIPLLSVTCFVFRY